MDWFPHQATARSDPKLVTLRRQFGPIGEVAWWHLLEVCTLEEGPLTVLGGDYKTARSVLALEPEWRCDLREILQAMTDLGLIIFSLEGNVETWQVARLNEYIGPASERREAWRTRKRKQRDREKATSGNVTGLSRDSHGVTEGDGHAGRPDTELTPTPTETLLPIALKGDVPKLPRQTVRQVSCPNCGAQPGSKCKGVSGERESNHMERVLVAAEASTKAQTKRREAIDDCATCGGRSLILDENDTAVDCPDCAPTRLRVVQ